MKQFLTLYAIATPLFFVIDMLWLGIVAKNFYREQLGAFLAEQVQWWAAIVFYLLFVVGIVTFVVQPALAKGSALHALLYGALFGLVTYAAYDLTNLATIKNWPLLVTGVDLVWGATICALVSSITVKIALYYSL